MRIELPSLPRPPDGADPAVLQYGHECALVGLFNERAAVLVELDWLAREFDAAGKPNTARRVRQAAAKIDARLREQEAASFHRPNDKSPRGHEGSGGCEGRQV